MLKLATKKKKTPKNGRKKSITAKNLKFLDEYIKTSNLTRSWIAAGYSENGACTTALQTLNKPHIYKEYQKRLIDIGKMADFEAQDVINELGRIAFANLDDYFERIDETVKDGDGEKVVSRVYMKKKEDIDRDKMKAISSIRETNMGLEIKLHSKTIALESLKKYFGLDNDADVNKSNRIKAGDRQQDINDPLADVTEEELDKELAKLDDI